MEINEHRDEDSPFDMERQEKADYFPAEPYVQAAPLVMDTDDVHDWYHPAQLVSAYRLLRHDLPRRLRRRHDPRLRLDPYWLREHAERVMQLQFEREQGLARSIELYLDDTGRVIASAEEHRVPRLLHAPVFPLQHIETCYRSLLHRALAVPTRRWIRRRSAETGISEAALKQLVAAVQPHLWYPAPQGLQALLRLQPALHDPQTRSSDFMQLVTSIGGVGNRVVIKIDHGAFAANAFSMRENLLSVLSAGPVTFAVLLSALQLIDEGSRSVRLFRLAAADWRVFTAALGTARKNRSIREVLVADSRGWSTQQLVPYWDRLRHATLVEWSREPPPPRFIADDFVGRTP